MKGIPMESKQFVSLLQKIMAEGFGLTLNSLGILRVWRVDIRPLTETKSCVQRLK